MPATATRTMTIRCRGFAPLKARLARIRYLGTITTDPAGPGGSWERYEFRHPGMGVLVEVHEDTLNRRDRDYALPVSEADALRLGMLRRAKAPRR